MRFRAYPLTPVVASLPSSVQLLRHPCYCFFPITISSDCHFKIISNLRNAPSTAPHSFLCEQSNKIFLQGANLAFSLFKSELQKFFFKRQHPDSWLLKPNMQRSERLKVRGMLVTSPRVWCRSPAASCGSSPPSRP
jgi:hypothetical protein